MSDASGELAAELTRVRAERDELARRVAAMEASTTWRIGRVVVGAADRARGILGRGPSSSPTPATRLRLPPHRPTDPLVTVVMAVRNMAATVGDSVASVVAQTLPYWELVIWDDGSTDPAMTRALDALAGPGIAIHRGRGEGVVAARNHAVARARGRYVAILDGDDAYEPTYLEKAVLFLEREPTVAIVAPWMRATGDLDEVVALGDVTAPELARSNRLVVAAVARREVYERTGGFSPAFADGNEDWELWAHAAELGLSAAVLPEPLFRYRVRHDAGRDAAARRHHAELHGRLLRLHPGLRFGTPPPAAAFEVNARDVIDRAVCTLPAGQGRPVVVLAARADDPRVVAVATAAVAEQRTAVVVIDGRDPADPRGVVPLLGITPFVYVLAHVLDPADDLGFTAQLLRRTTAPIVVDAGSRLVGAARDELPIESWGGVLLAADGSGDTVPAPWRDRFALDHLRTVPSDR
ncbi:MAG: glycosyltransferase family A protein [Acidimicrobiales bacterium]